MLESDDFDVHLSDTRLGGLIMTDRGRYAAAVRAPDFPSDLQWLNTDRPLTLADLRGKMVILDFWTYG
jgi:hypothetical protein